MNDEQLIEELNSILTLLNEGESEITEIQEKFQVALTGVLRLVGTESESTILSKLQGNVEDLKGYLIHLNSDVVQTTTKSYETLRNRIEEVLESLSSSDRKS
jgi:hypothetical protein